MRHLLNTGEVAVQLGVSRPRVSKLVAERADFPEPVAYTIVGSRAMKLWDAEHIAQWDDMWDRTPGRAPAREPVHHHPRVINPHPMPPHVRARVEKRLDRVARRLLELEDEAEQTQGDNHTA